MKIWSITLITISFNFNYSFETSNGIKREESAVVNNLGSDAESIAIKGTVSWIADDGQTYTLNFVADENGFQPQGNKISHTSS